MEISGIPYLIFYESVFFLWFIRTNKQIMFWLYLWQLKEYHWGRFIDHFATQKGRSIFLNLLFLAKIVLLAAGAAFAAIPVGRRAIFEHSDLKWLVAIYLCVLLLVYGADAVNTAISFFRKKMAHPGLTKKSLILIAAAHIVMYGLGLAAFFVFFGEMSLLDLCSAGLALTVLDVAAPLVVSAIVLGLQPLTIYEKNKILARAAAIIAARCDLLTIGIAGSYGKSITKELLAHILSSDFRVLKTLANQNTEIGVATRIINDLGPEHRVFVCEIGAVHRGRIRQVAGIVKPRIGILTGINGQHLAVFGNRQNIIDAKYEILEDLPKNGTAILNWQSLQIRDSFESQKTKIKAKNIVLAGKDFTANNIVAGIDILSFTLAGQGNSAPVKTNARGAFMVEPILLAVAAAGAAGMRFERAVEIINQTDFTPFNFEIGKNAAGINFVGSTYSANPDGVLSHLDYLKLWPGKKAIIMPCLIELGGASKEAHFEIGKKIAQVCDAAVITTKDRFGDIQRGAIGAGMKEGNIIFGESPVAIDKITKNRLAAGDAILLEGRMAQAIIDIIKK